MSTDCIASESYTEVCKEYFHPQCTRHFNKKAVYLSQYRGVTPIVKEEIQGAHLNGIYKDFAEVLGLEITIQIYNHFKGLQVTFPTKLLSLEYVKGNIIDKYNGSNARELARRYGYSERWIRQIVKENRDKKE